MKNKVPDILLIYTGGTIGMVKDYKTNALKAFNFERIKDKIPELKLLDCNIETVSFSDPIDSSDMCPEYWVKIAEIIEAKYDDIDGFVVLTGTDTMSYTASALSFMLENLNKPVIFTGSQLPIGDLRTDAKENLITAIQVAATQEDQRGKIREVGLYFEYKLYRANRTSKVSAEQFEAFESPNYPHLGISGVHLNFNDQWINKTISEKEFLVRKRFDSNVVILKLFPGIRKEMVEYILNCPDLEGVVLETYGAGNAPTSPWFIKILKNTLDRKIPVISVTQCTGGSVLMGHYESSIQLKNIGIINGKDITTESALAKMKYLIGQDTLYKDFKIKFETSLRGEMN